jgi:glycine cleavage system H protein
MSNVPANLRFTKDHEWLDVKGDIATVGITDYAQQSLGDLVFVELPAVGKKVTAGEQFAVVESVKAASEVYSPLSGEIVEVNTSLGGAPQSVNEAPYSNGWLAKIKLANPAEVTGTMTAADYTALLAKL